MRRGCQSGVNLEGTRQQIEENAISTLRLYSATGKPLCAPPCVPCGEWCVRFSLYLYLGPLSRFDCRSLVRAAAPDGAVERCALGHLAVQRYAATGRRHVRYVVHVQLHGAREANRDFPMEHGPCAETGDGTRWRAGSCS